MIHLVKMLKTAIEKSMNLVYTDRRITKLKEDM